MNVQVNIKTVKRNIIRRQLIEAIDRHIEYHSSEYGEDVKLINKLKLQGQCPETSPWRTQSPSQPFLVSSRNAPALRDDTKNDDTKNGCEGDYGERGFQNKKVGNVLNSFSDFTRSSGNE